MQFRFRDAPEWFHNHFVNYYVDELHSIQMAGKKSKEYIDSEFKQIAVEFFTNKGFEVWLDENNLLWFDVDPDSAKWTFEILRT
jgi:hypothetical protein